MQSICKMGLNCTVPGQNNEKVSGNPRLSPNIWYRIAAGIFLTTPSDPLYNGVDFEKNGGVMRAAGIFQEGDVYG